MKSEPFKGLLEDEQHSAQDFGPEWLRLAPARQFAAMLVGYRADHRLSQRELAAKLGVSQPRVARMESGEQNPDFETIIAAVRRLGTEFMLHVAAAGAETSLDTMGAPSEGAAATHDRVAVFTASSPAPPV